MAQTSGNRDEPSMEDILSSIRKIIQSNEDKDEGHPAEPVTEHKVAQAPADVPMVEEQEKPEPKLIIKPVEQEKPASPPEIRVSKPIDVPAPVAANAEVQSERGELTDAPARAPQAAVQEVQVEASVEEAPVVVAKAPVVAETPAPIAVAPVALVEPAPVPAPTPAAAPETMQSLAAQVVASAHVAGVEHVVAALEEKLNSPKADEVQAPQETRNTVPALISDDSGAKVAASFAELTQSFEEQADQNLEGIASDLLRPMLQDWLDNNLPSLVERLVREEIERVARGG